MSGTAAAPEGITNPPIDELLDDRRLQVRLVIYAAKRARQINAYYSPARRGPAGVRRPAGRDPRAGEAAVDRAARDQRRPAHRRADRAGLTALTADRAPQPTSAASRAPASSWRRRRHRRVQGRASCCGCSPSPATTSASCPPGSALQFVGARHLGGAVRPPGRHRRLGRRPRGAARAPRPAGRPRRRRPGHRRPAGPGRARPGRRPAHHHAAHRPLPGACWRPAMHTEMWEHPATVGQRRDPARARRRRPRPGASAG